MADHDVYFLDSCGDPVVHPGACVCTTGDTIKFWNVSLGGDALLYIPTAMSIFNAPVNGVQIVEGATQSYIVMNNAEKGCHKYAVFSEKHETFCEGNSHPELDIG